MGTLSITIGDSTISKDVDDVRLQRICNLYAAGLQYVDGAAFADGGPPTTDRQSQRAALAGAWDNMVNWAREQRRQELAAAAVLQLNEELK